MVRFLAALLLGFAIFGLTGCTQRGAAPPAASATVGGSTTEAAPAQSAAIASSAQGSGDSVAALGARTKPSVVEIDTVSVQRFRQTEGVGAGIIVDKQGHILTNYHVVQGAQQLQVIFLDGTKVTGTVLGTDASSDLAVVQVSASSNELVPVTFGDSSKVQAGDPVFAIGHPFGLSFSLTTGVVSAVNRDAPGNAPDGSTMHGMLQTDAALNPGNSGGPLFDGNGQLIGINEAVINPTGAPVFAGVGMAIASNVAKQELSSLIAGH